MNQLWSEFKTFAFKGSMIDLAVGVVIGAAFGSVVKSLVDNIIMPLVSYVTPGMNYTDWHLGRILIGKFIGDIISFLIIAIAVFMVIVKIMGYLMKRAVPSPVPGEPTTKECPMCLSTIPLKARKCGHCTADLEPGRI